jgi:hypothetical protein
MLTSRKNSAHNEVDIELQTMHMKGTCSVPGCTWAGLAVNFNKHAKGAGVGGKRRRGQHEDVDCAFVCDEKRSSQSVSFS